MAIQKTLDVLPSVAQRPDPMPPDTMPAKAIEIVGEGVKSFATSRKKGRFESELKSLGDEVFAARTGKQLEDTSDRFKRLQQAKEQGVLTQTMVDIEAEKILKETIGRMPGFAPELRKFAAEQIGYDPTGTQLRSLLNVQGGSSRQTFEEKQVEEAQFIADNLGVNVTDVMKIQAKSLLKKQQADIVANQAALGNFTLNDVVNSTLAEGDSYVTDVMSNVLHEIRAGGVVEPEQVTATVNASVLAQKQAMRDRLRNAGVAPDASKLQTAMQQIDQQWQPVIELAQSGAMAEILDRQASSLTSAMSIEAWNVMGDVALINKAAGQAGVDNYFKHIEKYGEDGQLALMKRTNPLLARHLDSVEDAKRLSAKAYKRIMGISPEYGDQQNILNNPEEEEAVTSLTDRLMYDVNKDRNMTDEEKHNRLQFAKQHGQKFKVLGSYFQRGARSAASSDEVRFVKQTVEEELPNLIDRIALDMATAKGTRDEYELVAEDGVVVKKFTGDRFTARPGRGQVSNWSGVQQVSPNEVTTADLKRLNAVNGGLVNGWAEDLGLRPLTFLGDTVAKINERSTVTSNKNSKLEEALRVYEENPSMDNWETVRKVDPDFASDVERYAGGVPGEADDE